MIQRLLRGSPSSLTKLGTRNGLVGSPTLHQRRNLPISTDQLQLWGNLILRNGSAACSLLRQIHERLLPGHGGCVRPFDELEFNGDVGEEIVGSINVFNLFVLQSLGCDFLFIINLGCLLWILHDFLFRILCFFNYVLSHVCMERVFSYSFICFSYVMSNLNSCF